MRNAFRQLPSELLDSALVDGCGYIRFFLWITLPLSRPILATVAVISFVVSWNNFLLPLVVINTNAKYPWTLGLMDYQGEFIVEWQLILAFITLTILPAIYVRARAALYRLGPHRRRGEGLAGVLPPPCGVLDLPQILRPGAKIAERMKWQNASPRSTWRISAMSSF